MIAFKSTHPTQDTQKNKTTIRINSPQINLNHVHIDVVQPAKIQMSIENSAKDKP